MRIVHITNYFMPEFGYQEFYLALFHARFGHEVHVLTSNRAYPLQQEYKVFKDVYKKRITETGSIEYMGFSVHKLPAILEFNMQLYIKNSIKKLKEINPDIVIAHSLSRWETLKVAFWKRLSKKRFVLIVDDHMLYSAYVNKVYRKAWYFFVRIFLKFALQSIKCIVAISEETKQFLIEKFSVPNGKIAIIPIGVDVDLFTFSYEKRKKIRSMLSIPEDAFVIIYAGKIVREKGCHLVYEVSREYLKKHENVYLLYVGSGIYDELANEIREKAKEDGVSDKVLWHGHVAHHELPAFYSAADVAIWPFQETMSALEASACSVPIILRNSLIAKERTAGGNGFACATIEEQKEALGRLIVNPALRWEMGRKGARYMRENFSWERIAKRFIEVALLPDQEK